MQKYFLGVYPSQCPVQQFLLGDAVVLLKSLGSHAVDACVTPMVLYAEGHDGQIVPLTPAPSSEVVQLYGARLMWPVDVMA